MRNTHYISWFLSCILCSLVCIFASLVFLEQLSLEPFMPVSGAHINSELKQQKTKQNGNSRELPLRGLPHSLLCWNYCWFQTSREPGPRPLTSQLILTREEKACRYGEQGAPVAHRRGQQGSSWRVRMPTSMLKATGGGLTEAWCVNSRTRH